MSAPEIPPIAPPPGEDGGPTFEAPWQAQVLAIADALTVAGLFSPVEWSEALGAELRSAADRGDEDTQRTYYLAALAALERLVCAEGVVDPDVLARRADFHREARDPAHRHDEGAGLPTPSV